MMSDPSASQSNADRNTLEAAWLVLTREALPALAASRGWPIRLDHCFQRVLLDNAVGGRWYDHISGRPAYRHATDAQLRAALDLGAGVIAASIDLTELNRRSLMWRGKRARA